MKWVALLAALLLLAAGTLALWRANAPASSDSTQSPADGGVATERTSSVVGEAPQTPTSAIEIDASQRTDGPSAAAASNIDPISVPSGIALRDSIEALLELSRAGNREATKRLFRELTECLGFRNANRQVDVALAMEEMGRNRPRSGEFLQQMMNRAAETVAKLDEQCQDLPENYDSALLFEVQRRAADMGDLAGQLAFVVAPAIDLNRAIEQRDRIEIFAELAPQFAQAALQQSSGQAVFALMNGYDSQPELWRNRRGGGSRPENAAMQRAFLASVPRSAFQQALGSDDAKAYQYALLCKRVCNFADIEIATTTAARLEGGLASDARALARTNADDLFDRFFAGKPRPDDIDLIELRMAASGFMFRMR